MSQIEDLDDSIKCISHNNENQVEIQYDTRDSEESTTENQDNTLKLSMVDNDLQKALIKQSYSLVGSHSAVKLCRWTKSMLRRRGACYKHTFYGIDSSKCMQMTTSLACANRCIYCWRHQTGPVSRTWKWKTDTPQSIITDSIMAHKKLIKQVISGTNWNIKKEKERKPEKQETDPQEKEISLIPPPVSHCALSLVGEALMYPKINEYIQLLHSKNISTFLVTNAQLVENLDSLCPVTQLYISIDAPDPEKLKELDRPLFNNFWDRLLKCIQIISHRPERTVYRLTLLSDLNMYDVEGYANLIQQGNPCFIECKGATYSGEHTEDEGLGSKLTMKNSPYYSQVFEFSQFLEKKLENYEIMSVHQHSCTVLLARKDFYDPIMKQWKTWIDFNRFFELFINKKKFSPLDYSIVTPSWAIYNNNNTGFDPSFERHYRQKQRNESVRKKSKSKKI